MSEPLTIRLPLPHRFRGPDRKPRARKLDPNSAGHTYYLEPRHEQTVRRLQARLGAGTESEAMRMLLDLVADQLDREDGADADGSAA